MQGGGHVSTQVSDQVVLTPSPFSAFSRDSVSLLSRARILGLREV